MAKAHQGTNSQVRGRDEREQVERMGLGFCFYWGHGLGPKVLQAHSLFVNLKYKNEHLKAEKRKNSPNGQLSKSTTISENKDASVEEGEGTGSLSSHVANMMFV